MRSSEIGACLVWCREDTDAWVLDPACWDDLKRAWLGGVAFFVGQDCYGDEVVVKLGAVTVIQRRTPEGAAALAADLKADKLTEDIG